MHDTIGRTTHGHQHHDRIFNRFFCHHLSGRNAFFHQSHDCPSGLICHLKSFRVNSRDHRTSRKAHAHGLCQTSHSIGRSQHGTGTCTRFRQILNLTEFFFINLASLFPANGFCHDISIIMFSFITGRHHRTAVAKYRRNIQSGCCHQKSRYNFVTGSQQNKSVKPMRPHHTFHS